MSLKDKVYSVLDEVSYHVSAGRLYYKHLSTEYDPPFVTEFIETPRFNYQYCSNVLLRVVIPAAVGTIAAGPVGGMVLFSGSLLESGGEMVIAAAIWTKKVCKSSTEEKEAAAIQ